MNGKKIGRHNIAVKRTVESFGQRPLPHKSAIVISGIGDFGVSLSALFRDNFRGIFRYVTQCAIV